MKVRSANEKARHSLIGMMRFFDTPQRPEEGYSLIELITVVSVLGILASITIPRIGNIVAYNNIDEAKALLNTLAADCLQKSRLNSENKQNIDESIVSNKRINPIGFKLDDKASNCSYFQMLPIENEDNIRFPIGFSVSDGFLSKFANPTSTDQGSIKSCERWAGVNCKQDQGLKTLIDWKDSITAAKETCENSYRTWLNDKNTQPRQYVRWDSNADASCPERPPNDGSTSYKTSPNCSTAGCTKIVYGLDGEFVGFTEDDYERALEAKYGKACTEWVATKQQTNYTNNPQNRPATLKECGAQEFWFHKGVDLGSKEEFDKKICNDNLETEKKKNGKRQVQGCGTQIYYFCNNAIKDSEKDYKECSCGVDKYNRAQAGNNGKFSTTEQGAQGCGDFWICNKEILDDEGTYISKCGQTAPPKTSTPAKKGCKSQLSQCDNPKYYKNKKCIAYSQCMGFI